MQGSLKAEPGFESGQQQQPGDAKEVAAPTPEELAKASKEAETKRKEAEERRQYEDEVLKKARVIRDARSWLRCPPASEPKRGKMHWDHLLEEMTWLSKEFSKERKWKLQMAKRYANAAQRSNMDLESRVLVKAKEEKKAIKKRAAWIAKEVMIFWGKAQRVVQYKVRTKVEAKKKQVLDKQLDFLLGQTQKYSSMLAQRLTVEERADAVVAASRAADALPIAAADQQQRQYQIEEIEQEGVDTAQPTQTQRRAAALAAQEHRPPSAAVSGVAAADADDSRDYRSGEDDDADDEATLEEEERIAQQEGKDLKKEEKIELKGLEDEADLPLEELLARYGYVVPDDEDAAMVEATSEAAGPSTRGASKSRGDVKMTDQDDDGSDNESEKLAALLKDPMDTAAGPSGSVIPPPPAPAVPAVPVVPSRLAEEFEVLGEEGDLLEQSGSDQPDSHLEDGDEYRSGEDDDADDEATLEEEERIAQQEGKDLKKEEKIELKGLEDEADLPLKELLARYGYVVPDGENDKDAITTDKAIAADKKKGKQPATTAATGAATTITDEVEDVDEAGVEGATEEERMLNALNAMVDIQPTGYTLDTAKVKTPVPFLMRGTLREYQHIGLDWLATLYHKRLNGILADEMGLGKTIQTISLLAWLACERGDWGPHLVVVPTSVMLNWEMEFKKWCPAFKLLTYYGSPKERAAKRQGWSKPNSFHVCITSYTLVLQDSRMFKRKKWKYLILDEAHMIKNWKSQRWQNLLNFNSKRRLLLTGTPLQNDLMELWSLMHFLMPQVFASHAQFKDWFSNPLTGMVEGSAEYNRAIIERLHNVLRPFLLRRLKRDVEKQLPGKHEHVLYCRLSKRQRLLYEEYMSSSDTRSTLASGNFLGIMSCLMQLRKVCNHPDLFEGRPIVSAYDMEQLSFNMPSVATHALTYSRDAMSAPIDLAALGLLPLGHLGQGAWEAQQMKELEEPSASFQQPGTSVQEDLAFLLGARKGEKPVGSLLDSLGFRPRQPALAALSASIQNLAGRRREWRTQHTSTIGVLSSSRIASAADLPLGIEAVSAVRVTQPAQQAHVIVKTYGGHLEVSNTLLDMVKLPERRAHEMHAVLEGYTFAIPKARAAPPSLVCSHPDVSAVQAAAERSQALTRYYNAHSALLHVPRLRTQLFFPDRRLVQYDCGKLQELALLLMKLKAGGHRALIFTQMSKMLDVLEVFLNLHGYTYVRLDGATKPETRQILMQRFNTDDRIFVFILSTRSGGVGMNLTGADTVIFYDSDWNPAMDAQAQDRCHRIGQTREVHIYRLVSEHTIEENILRKSDQKRQLDFLAIQSGGFTTDFFNKFDPGALLTVGGGGNTATQLLGLPAPSTSAGQQTQQQQQQPPSADAIMAAMRAAEDEGDAAAAAAAAQETAAEMDEFIKEPPPAAVLGADGGEAGEEAAGTAEDAGTENGVGDKANEEADAPTATTATNPEEELQLLGGESLDQLASALNPVEQYAVRYLEDVVGMAADGEVPGPEGDELKLQEIDVNAIEEQEEEREAEIDEDEEANVAGDWDAAAATAAFEAERAAAEAAEKEREEAEAAWLAQYAAQFPASLEPSSMMVDSYGIPHHRVGGKKGGARGSKGAISGHGIFLPIDTADTAMSPRGFGVDGLRAAKRARHEPTTVVQPWDQQEDLVLCASVASLLESGIPLSHMMWSTVAHALAAGAAATTMTGIDAAAKQGKLRTANACALRYSMLEAARSAAEFGTAGSAGEAFASRLGNLKQRLAAALAVSSTAAAADENQNQHIGLLPTPAVPEGQDGLITPAALPPYPHEALTAVYHILQAAASRPVPLRGYTSTSSITPSRMLRVLQELRQPDAAAVPAVVELPAEPALQQAQDLAAAIRSRVKQGAARVITSRLPVVLEAAQTGGAWAAREALKSAASGASGRGGQQQQTGDIQRGGSGGLISPRRGALLSPNAHHQQHQHQQGSVPMTMGPPPPPALMPHGQTTTQDGTLNIGGVDEVLGDESWLLHGVL